ncbi:HU family DNA-binding protein, partial [Streptomyces lunaelactis]|uniref:HU family DNA-binding protein n=1 Tax=Streptomyces lunaelactis TaxID=1535768 RepID=UPI0020C7DF9C
MKTIDMLWASPLGPQADAHPEGDPGSGLSPLPAAWRAPRHHDNQHRANSAVLHTNRRESPVNKAQLVEAVAPQTGGRAQAVTAVDAVLDAIVRAVVAGDTVSVTGFGTLQARDRDPRIARNPQTGDEVKVPATRVLRFRPGARFKDLVVGRKPLPATGNSIQK